MPVRVRILAEQIFELCFQVLLLAVVLAAFLKVFTYGEDFLDLADLRGSLLQTGNGEPISKLFLNGARVTVELLGGSLCLAGALAVGLAWSFVVWPQIRWARTVITCLSAFPVFALAYWLRRASDWPHLYQAIVVLALGDFVLATMVSQGYTELRSELGRSYILAARARGEPAWHSYWRRLVVISLECLRPRIPFLLGSSVVVERIYALDGLGNLAVNSVERGEVAVLLWIAVGSLILVRAYAAVVELLRSLLTPEHQPTDAKAGRSGGSLLHDLLGSSGRWRRSGPRGSEAPIAAADVGRRDGEAGVVSTAQYLKGRFHRLHAIRLRFSNYLCQSAGNRIKAFSALLLTALSILFLVSCLTPPGKDPGSGLSRQFEPPSWQHWMGRDEDGKDIFSQLRAAGHCLMPPAVASLLLVMLVSTPLGVVSGYFGGSRTRLIDRLMDVLDSVPKLVLVMLAIVVFDARRAYLWKVVPFIGLTFAPAVFYQVRDVARLLRARLFVERARTLGCSETRIIFKHLLWINCLHRLAIQSAGIFGGIILMDASVGYLKLSQPDFPTWGGLMVKGVRSAEEYVGVSLAGTPFNAWAAWGPALVLFALLVSSMLASEGLRIVLDEKG